MHNIHSNAIIQVFFFIWFVFQQTKHSFEFIFSDIVGLLHIINYNNDYKLCREMVVNG